MKKLYLLLAIAMFTNFAATAQPYQSLFGNDSTIWNMWFNVTASSPSNFTRVYKVDRDTLINNITYKVVTINNIPQFYLREDLQNSKVWYMYADTLNFGSHEFLYADFNLTKGDSFQLNPPYQIRPFLPIYHVDTIYYDVMNLKHIRFKEKFLYNSTNCELIEGIGYNFGLWVPDSLYWAKDVAVLCKWKNENKIYSLDLSHHYCEYSDSLYNSLGVTNASNPKYIVYPNPTGNQIFISGNTSKIHYIIFDISGKIFQSGIAKDEIDISKLPNGIHVLKISNQIFRINKLK